MRENMLNCIVAGNFVEDELYYNILYAGDEFTKRNLRFLCGGIRGISGAGR